MRDQLFIDGRWTAGSGGTLPVYDPSTGQEIHRVAAAGPDDVDAAVAAARTAFPSWARTPSAERARLLDAIAAALGDRAEELARLSSRINGKPLAEARVDLEDAAGTYAYYAGLARALDAQQDAPVPLANPGFEARLRREPAGVAALITPWNFPLVTSAWKLAPALAAGCTVVLKPSEFTAPLDLELGAIAEAVGLPAGVLNILPGSGEAVGAPLCAHPGVAKISFTGSNAVGERVMETAAHGTKRVALELGGKSAILVFADADLDHAADLVVSGLFTNAGQMCSATGRLLVERSAYRPLLDRLVARARALKVGPGLDPATEMGPLTTAAQHRKVLSVIERAKADGATLVTGGGIPQGRGEGWFVEPTIFTDVRLDSALWREEVFGPVLAVHPFEDEAEAVRLANDSDFGLVGTVISGDDARAERVAEALEVGVAWIDCPQMVFVEASWGGYRRSGIGRELGPWGLAAFQEIKHVVRPKRG
ncbi:aldehyde dehydrogenase family protein [Azospirillum sp. TSO35-2]|uniref:aldehyde dehydrogenase family protein n=1 Tax=Azospirillum sp. TSO35-2 TaxID=716796 RepID=UPI000D621498|nr:aldehyde dehydrogenase family protein [Azospirillum sp. TSO35-2]PWC36261.1 aldehyde dehydrogenase [Azospirillum sp. TSO35-2]